MPDLPTRLAAALALAVGLLPVATAAARPPTPAVQQARDRVVAAGAPGSVALADGRVTVSGVADLDSRRPLRAGDRVRIGSVTKTFVAAVALQLVDEGRLRLDDTVGARLPGVLPYADGVTLRQLLDHTSGVPDDVPTIMMRVWTPSELIELVDEQRAAGLPIRRADRDARAGRAARRRAPTRAGRGGRLPRRRAPADRGRGMTIRLLLADDHELVRTGLRLLVATHPDVEVVVEAGDGVTAVAAAGALRPDVILMDVRMPRIKGYRKVHQFSRRRHVRQPPTPLAARRRGE